MGVRNNLGCPQYPAIPPLFAILSSDNLIPPGFYLSRLTVVSQSQRYLRGCINDLMCLRIYRKAPTEMLVLFYANHVTSQNLST